MRQMAALLSFWQNGSASDYFREGKRGIKSDSSKQTCFAQAVRPAVLRGRVCPERCAAGYLCPSHRLSSPLWNVAAQPCRGRIAGACVQACEPLRTRRATRLIPFLPTLVEALERHEHLHLTEECRRQLLSMSAATADRLLRSQRKVGQRGLSTTRAGTLLKQQIPLRTFEEWKQTRPGFLEAGLVAHCGTDIDGRYPYTLTLTDVATGWTECLPLLHRSQDAVLAALRRARTLFPFPILGIDTDNGVEFINEVLIAYCEQEHLTFTRGRPYLKNDQCFVEQKNGAMVRHVVGYDRFVGEHAYRQLTELYRALRLYVNCFQPSMKLLSKQREGKNVRYVYDSAKTPLQRLLQSGVLPAEMQQELLAVAHALDAIRLFEQLEQLQQAVFRCAVGGSRFL